MPIPPATDNLIRTRFASLIQECEQLQREAEEDAQKSRPRPGGIPPALMRDKLILSGTLFDSLKTRFLTLLQVLSGGSSYISRVMEDVRQLSNTQAGVDTLIGKIRGIKDDYENGMLINLVELIEANMAADYLGQAEQLLNEGQRGNFDYVPAAVLLGAILEDALRRLCLRQTRALSIVNSNGEPKTLNPLIDELKKANIFRLTPQQVKGQLRPGRCSGP